MHAVLSFQDLTWLTTLPFYVAMRHDPPGFVQPLGTDERPQSTPFAVHTHFPHTFGHTSKTTMLTRHISVGIPHGQSSSGHSNPSRPLALPPQERPSSCRDTSVGSPRCNGPFHRLLLFVSPYYMSDLTLAASRLLLDSAHLITFFRESI